MSSAKQCHDWLTMQKLAIVISIDCWLTYTKDSLERWLYWLAFSFASFERSWLSKNLNACACLCMAA
jgi:hypothetical protein